MWNENINQNYIQQTERKSSQILGVSAAISMSQISVKLSSLYVYCGL